MKKFVFLGMIWIAFLAGCKKTGYTCHQKITTKYSNDSMGYPRIEFSEFQLKGSNDCVIGIDSLKSIVNGRTIKTLIFETTCN